MTSLRSIADSIATLNPPGLDDSSTPDEQPAAAEVRQDQSVSDELAGDQMTDQPPADGDGSEDSPEGSEEAAPTNGQSEQQPTDDGEPEELPDTLSGIAEYLGLEVEDMLDGVSHKIGKSGQEKDLTLRELFEGQLRTADYTQKTQELSQQRRAFEEYARNATAQYEQAVVQSMAGIKVAEQQLHARARELEPLRGSVEHASEYGEAIASLNRDLQALQQAKATTIQQYNTQVGQFRNQYAERQRAALFQARPNVDVAKDGQVIGRVLDSLGFSAEEASTVLDHRLWLGALELHETRLERDALRKQMAGTKARAKKKLKRKGPPRTGRPGRQRSDAQKAQTTRLQAHKRLKKSGSAKDAAQLLERFLPGE